MTTTFKTPTPDRWRRRVGLAALLVTLLATTADAQYSAAVLADNPIGYWRFEEVAGSAIDSSGNSRDGTYMNGVTPGLFPGPVGIGGTAAAFDGSTGFVDLPGSWGGVGMTELTLEAWVNTADPPTGDFQAIIAGHDPNSFAHFQLHNVGSTGPYTDVGFISAPIPAATPTGVWRHVVMTAKSGETKVYVDGAQIGATVPTAFSNIAESSNVDIGIGHVGTRWFSGLMDEVAIYDTALSEERVLAHLVAGGGTPPPPPPPPPAATLLAHWTFDNDASDETGNHDGSLQGGAAITADAQVGPGALDLRDVNGFVDVPTAALNGEASYSIAMFVSVDSVSHACCHALFANDGFGAGALHVNVATGNGVPEAAVSGNPGGAWGRDAPIPIDGQWVHLAFTYDSATGVTTPYINGVAGNPTAGGSVSTVGVGPATIGAWNPSGGEDRFHDGRIDDLRIYSGVLSDDDVSRLAAIPEPSTIVLGVLGLIGAVGSRRRNWRG